MFNYAVTRNVARSFLSEFKRNINKTTSVTNSERLATRIESKINDELTNTKLLKLKDSTRALSVHSNSLPLAATGTAASKDESREFMAVFPDIVRDLTGITGRNPEVSDATNWFAKVLQYNVPGGKKNRGLATVASYKMLVKPDSITPESLHQAIVLGWCVEIFQACFLVLDDIMDHSKTRRGQPCWYLQEGVGMTAINDGIMLEAGLYALLRKHFSTEPYYVQIVELFHEVYLKTIIGQNLDLNTAQQNDPKLHLFTMDRYNTIVKYKTALYSFYLPVALAMHMVGNHDVEMHRQAKTILLEMGQCFQVQDDFLDCFGNPEVTGKIGTDIQDGKCTWLAVVAMQRASAQQKQIMAECYGKEDTDKVNKIKALYEELGVPNTYALYEEESYNLIKTHIQQISRGLQHNLFFKFMEKIYRRES